MNKIFKGTVYVVLSILLLIPIKAKAETNEEMLNRILNSIPENYELKVSNDIECSTALLYDLSVSIKEQITIGTNCENNLCTIALGEDDKFTKQVTVTYKQDNEDDKRYVLEASKKLKSNRYKLDTKKYWKDTIKRDTSKDYNSILIDEVKKVINDDTIEVKLTPPRGGLGYGPGSKSYFAIKELYLLKNGIIYYAYNDIVTLEADNIIYVPYGTKKEDYINEAKKVYSEISDVDINKISLALTDDLKSELGNKEIYKITYSTKAPDNTDYDYFNYYYIEVADKEVTSNITNTNNSINNNNTNKNNNSNNTSSNNEKDNIDNPQTGVFIPTFGFIIGIIMSCIILYKVNKKKVFYKI